MISAGTATAQIPHSQMPGARHSSRPERLDSTLDHQRQHDQPPRSATAPSTRPGPCSARRPTTSSVTTTINMPVSTAANSAADQRRRRALPPSTWPSTSQCTTGLAGSVLSTTWLAGDVGRRAGRSAPSTAWIAATTADRPSTMRALRRIAAERAAEDLAQAERAQRDAARAWAPSRGSTGWRAGSPIRTAAVPYGFSSRPAWLTGHGWPSAVRAERVPAVGGCRVQAVSGAGRPAGRARRRRRPAPRTPPPTAARRRPVKRSRSAAAGHRPVRRGVAPLRRGQGADRVGAAQRPRPAPSTATRTGQPSGSPGSSLIVTTPRFGPAASAWTAPSSNCNLGVIRRLSPDTVRDDRVRL